MDILLDLIASFDSSSPNFRPTELYNENWLVKLVLQQAPSIQDEGFPLSFLTGSSWFSEALLPTAFKARTQGDKLAESRTHADGVIGQIQVGAKGKADLKLQPNASQLTVVEAKLGSPLSPGTTNAPYFDQAARNVACMAELLARRELQPSSLKRLDFIVLAPQHAIDEGTFDEEMHSDSIRSKVMRRVSEYGGELDHWQMTHFEPTMDRVRLHSLSWEKTLQWIGQNKPEAEKKLREFYDLCLEFS
jgi:hypothetical protein